MVVTRTLHLPATRPSLRAVALVVGLVAVVLLAGAGAGSAVAAAPTTLFGTTQPALDHRGRGTALEVGVAFSSAADGRVLGLRFWKSSDNTGPHTGSLWGPDGTRLGTVTFTGETGSGWQQALFAQPVAVRAGALYVASYSSPTGTYSMTRSALRSPVTSGDLTVPASGGRSGTPGAVPREATRNNLFADVLYERGAAPVPPTTTTTSTTTSATPPPSTTTAPGTGALTLALPRVPWEGGAAYYARFPVSAAGGWASPDHFPVAIWWDAVGSDAEAQFDKSKGINSYVNTNPGVPYSVFADNGLSWIGDRLNATFPDTGTAWAGNFLGDEVDGRYAPADGQAVIAQKLASIGDNGRFSYANYTAIVASNYNPTQLAADDTYVNMYEGPVSVDAYWYTDTHCSDPGYRDWSFVPIPQQYCRTASSYGKTVQSVRARDASDGKLKPVWSFVELMGGGNETTASGVYITPQQIQGAVMSSLISEARGIVYFNQSFQGPCQGGNLIRTVQVDPSSCAAANIAGMATVNAQIQQLAPVLNSQSYQYSPGPGLDTMLKTYGGSMYLFAMVDGASPPGARTFRLPPGVSATSAQVLFENRTVPIDGTGTFTDTFAQESSYHIYKVTP